MLKNLTRVLSIFLLLSLLSINNGWAETLSGTWSGTVDAGSDNSDPQMEFTFYSNGRFRWRIVGSWGYLDEDDHIWIWYPGMSETGNYDYNSSTRRVTFDSTWQGNLQSQNDSDAFCTHMRIFTRSSGLSLSSDLSEISGTFRRESSFYVNDWGGWSSEGDVSGTLTNPNPPTTPSNTPVPTFTYTPTLTPTEQATLTPTPTLTPTVRPTMDFDSNGDGIVDREDLFNFMKQWHHQKSPSSGGDEITIDLPGGVTLEMVKIPSGSFQMGSPSDEQDRDSDEGPQHEVNIDQFWMGKYEVTIGQYREFLLATGDESGVDWSDSDCPLNRSGGDYVLSGNSFGQSWDQPMVEVSWYGAKAFADWLTSEYSGTFRLPSEAEWEYAARAGTTTRFYWGDDPSYTQIGDYAWYSGNNSPSGTKEVGQKLPNAFGLYDMSGNVWEWCEDDWHDNYNGAPTDGSAWVDLPRGSSRVLRGGGWDRNARYCRSAARGWSSPGSRYDDYGFRIVRTQ